MALSKSLDSLTYFLADDTRFNFVTIGHALYILSVNKRQGVTNQTHYWLNSLLWAILRSTGGGLLRSLILGERAAVFTDRRTIPTIVALWYLMYGTDWFPQIVDIPLIQGVVLPAIEALSKLRTITGGSDRANTVLGDSPAANVIVATLSGCGGSLLFDIEKKTRANGNEQLSNWSQPLWVFKLSFFSALFYNAAVHQFKVLNPRTARLYLGLFLLFNYIARGVWKPTFNYFAEVGLEDFFYKITGLSPKPKPK